MSTISYYAEVVRNMSTRFQEGDQVIYQVLNERGDFELRSEEGDKKESFGFAYKGSLAIGEEVGKEKRIKSKYQGLHRIKNNGEHKWHVKYIQDGEYVLVGIYKLDQEREAAIAYDKAMLRLGKDPVNILKKTNK